MNGHYKSLAQIKQGGKAVVHHLTGGLAVRNRLLVLGFTEGAQVKVQQNSGFGPVIVVVRDSRIALGRGEASRVLVREVSQD